MLPHLSPEWPVAQAQPVSGLCSVMAYCGLWCLLWWLKARLRWFQGRVDWICHLAEFIEPRTWRLNEPILVSIDDRPVLVPLVERGLITYFVPHSRKDSIHLLSSGNRVDDMRDCVVS